MSQTTGRGKDGSCALTSKIEELLQQLTEEEAEVRNIIIKYTAKRLGAIQITTLQSLRAARKKFAQ